MKHLWLVVLVCMVSCGKQFRIPENVEGHPVADTSYIYTLPFPIGTTHRLIQGYNSSFSHKGRIALDFKMKKGSPVTAARAGVVVRVEQNYTKGGVNKKYLGKANQIIIRHDDGSQAYYGHLMHNGARVKPGDTVVQGQLLGLSGSTGYSALPHLHFIVWGPVPGGGRSQLPTRFYTQKGTVYLKPGKRYENKVRSTP